MTELLLNILDILRETCFYYCTFGFLFSLNGNTLSVPVSFLISLVSAVLCYVLKRQRTLAYAPILLLSALVFPQVTTAKLMTAVPLAAYYVLKTHRDAWHADYDNTHAFMTYGTALFAMTVFISLVFIQGHGAEVRSIALPLFFLFALLTVFELRMLRNDAVKNFGQKYILLNFAALLLIAAVVLILGSPAAVNLFMSALKWFYNTVIAPILMVLLFITMVIPYAIYYLVRFLKPGGFSGGVEMPKIESITEQLFPDLDNSYTENPWISRILEAVLIIAVIVVIFLILRRMADRNRYRTTGSASYTRESLAPSEVKKRRKSVFRLNDPSEEVRAAYRSYLTLCAKEGIPTDGSIASDEICRITEEKLHTQDADELRKLWLPVRFSAEADDSGAGRAKELLKALRRSFRELK